MRPLSGPSMTRAQVREVDRRAIEEFYIPGMVLMENAGRGASELISDMIRSGDVVAVVCGPGNNGGDGFVIARHLANRDVPVEVYLACDPARLTGDARTNHMIIEKMRLPCHQVETAGETAAAAIRLGRASIIVDALLGTGAAGDPRPPIAQVIEAINSVNGAKVVAVDIPSGLDCDTGRPGTPTIRADETITFVAFKKGFDAAGAMAYTGRIRVVDIGAPRQILQDVVDAGSG